MTDRTCIFSKGAIKFHYSIEDIISCYDGCQGGSVDEPYFLWVGSGIVSGGPYNSHEGCLPYEVAPCGNYCTIKPTPPCRRTCQKSYPKSYNDDKRKGSKAYSLDALSLKEIKIDILTSGPISNSMQVYADFIHYKSGIYHRTSEDILGEHVIKILGWGTENGTDYWLAANSWGVTWGDKGFFKMSMATNDFMQKAAGIPKLD